MWGIFLCVLIRMRVLNKKNTDIEMIVLIHTIWHVIAELSLPSWQRDARDITYQVINAISEAKKDETAV